MRVLITGGTGFIGSRLALKCLEKNDEVRILAQENTDAEIENRKLIEKAGAAIISGTVTDKVKVAESVQGIDIVYHLAAIQHEMNIPDKVFWDVNVTGTKNVLEASVESGVKRFVHGSTIGVYGSMEGEINEGSPCNPDNVYGITKLEGERLAFSFREKVPLVIIRISEVYGPADRRLLKLFNGIKKNVFFVIGSGNNLHHLIYVDDLIKGFFLAAENEKELGQVFVLSGKNPITTGEMVKTIADELGVSLPKVRLPLMPFLLAATVMEATLRPLGIQPPLHRRRMDFFRKSFNFSPKKSREILGFEPDYSFRQGVTQTIKWYEAHGLL
jgi:nucleoside-diphosphate-sugar epimerase